ncbi:MAG: hypothetical protein P4M09_22275 [Devosia sp.]|nr:hypothetical protein [Devosia sp.]
MNLWIDSVPENRPSSDEMEALIRSGIERVKAQTNGGVVGLVEHRPETWAEASHCFENAARKARESGGQIIFGWTFQHRFVEQLSGAGYLVATHHAVWHAPDTRLIDVTPYPDARHTPLGLGGSTIFLVDGSARPVERPGLIGPLPLRYFALVDEPGLPEHLRRLTDEENRACVALYGPDFLALTPD